MWGIASDSKRSSAGLSHRTGPTEIGESPIAPFRNGGGPSLAQPVIACAASISIKDTTAAFIPTAIRLWAFVAEYSGALTGLLPQHQHVAVALPVRMVKAPLAGEYARSPVGSMFQLVARFVCPVRTQDRFIGMVVVSANFPGTNLALLCPRCGPA